MAGLFQQKARERLGLRAVQNLSGRAHRRANDGRETPAGQVRIVPPAVPPTVFPVDLLGVPPGMLRAALRDLALRMPATVRHRVRFGREKDAVGHRGMPAAVRVTTGLARAAFASQA